MGIGARPMLKSKKKIVDLNELVSDKIFLLPRSMANSIDIVTGKPCVFVGVNGKATYVLVEEKVPIPYNVFCALKDIGKLNYKYTDGELFEPL